MTFHETRLQSWTEFRDHADAMSPEGPNEVTFFFRGQADARWPMKSSLLRYVNSSDAALVLSIEDGLLTHFHRNVLRFSRQEDVPHMSVRLDRLAWWALMQHHGAPTRLLDFTESPYVAAYFAAASAPDVDGAIFAVHRDPLETAAVGAASPRFVLDQDEAMRSPNAPPVLRTYFPARQTERFAAQQGVFIYSDSVAADVDQALVSLSAGARAAQPDKYILEKLVVTAELKRELLLRLRSANISGLTLFPGLDGLGRYAAETARLLAGT